MFGTIKNTVKKLDPRIATYEIRTLESQLDRTLLTERLIAMMSAGFGALATLLASIGLYGGWRSSSLGGKRRSGYGWPSGRCAVGEASPLEYEADWPKGKAISGTGD